MKKLYATLFSALFLGGAICASCTDKKDASAEEVINTIHKVNNYWQTNHPEHGRSFWDNAAYHTGNMEAYFSVTIRFVSRRKPISIIWNRIHRK